MIVAFDNTFLSLALNPNTKPTPNPATNTPVEHCYQRIEALIDFHSKNKDKVIIPTPCLAELLSAVPDVEKATKEINRSAAFTLAPFDGPCAIELAKETREACVAGDKRAGVKAGWLEIKFDRQIAVIAKVGSAEIFYTDDENQSRFAEMLGMKVVHTWDLCLPAKHAQMNFIDEQG